MNVYNCRLDFSSAARTLYATHSPQAHIHIRTRFSNVLEIFLVLFLYIRVLFFSFFCSLVLNILYTMCVIFISNCNVLFFI